jgi:uncharacterized membrane protein
MKSRKMLSTLCRGQLNAVPRFPCIKPVARVQPRPTCRLISSGDLGNKALEASSKKTESTNSSTVYSKRIESYINDGHLKLNFEGRVLHQEVADEENISDNQYKLFKRCFVYSVVWGTVWAVSWSVVGGVYYHPLCYDILAVISPIGTVVSAGIMDGASDNSKKHEEKAKDLYKDICRKYQVTKPATIEATKE